ncbi:MAG: tetratricopeptide repeat protein [Thermoflexales bacterium]|nr:tetratricopeptide repeat protein [Thermoflexales bacterium]
MEITLPQAVASYVPAYVVRRVLEGKPPLPGEAVSIKAAVLFADIAGFTTMTERMVRLLSERSPGEGHRASEEINHVLNQVFGALIEPVLERGGDVTHFSGDALTACFERPAGGTHSACITCALSCARAMQRAMAPFFDTQVAGHPLSISLKVGLGYGPARRLTVGDARLDLESVLAGDAVNEASRAEKHARQGEIVISRQDLGRLDPPPAIAELREDFAALVGGSAGETCPAGGAAPLDLGGLSDPEAFLATLAPYLPREVYDALALTGGDMPGDFRRVTNIFVGFEGLDYDAPQAGRLLQDYYTWAQGIVSRFEGRINRLMTGDKGSVLHILFGAPGKHDDDPLRALRCALALNNDPDRPVSVTAQRIGIASGIVLARPLGSALRREYTVIGDEINLSSRLMTAAGSGAILVDSYTRDRTAQRFAFESLPPLQLKGKQQPVKAYRLLAERETETGLTARYLSSRWELVGRDAERATLLAAAKQAMGGTCQVIAISGRAGVGKTRLVEEVVRYWVDWGGNGYMGQSMSHGINSPYLPWIELWRVFFDFHEADDAAARWQRVEASIAALAGELGQWAGVLGTLLGLPAPESAAIAALDASDRRGKLFELTIELLRARASRQPLLLLFEDLHWADRPSLELIDHVTQKLGNTPLLVCTCFRPRDDLSLASLALPACTRVELEELPPETSAQMVRTILRQARLPAEFEREVYNKTQGNPLFVEELLNSLVDSGTLVRDNSGYKIVGDLAQARVPDTLQDLLMARIDRLESSSRDLLQVASVIDRRFGYEILRGIYPYHMADVEMRDRLESTISMDLTRLDHPEPDLAYLFKHTMTYEVAYNSLPFARRRELHDRVGDFLEVAHFDDLEQYYPVLARHFGQSERWDKTLVYALAAGSQAQELYANDEALEYYEHAERCLKELPVERYWINALRLYLNRAELYRLKGQYDLAEADIERALELAQAHQDTRAQAEGYNILAELRYWQGRNEEARQAAQLAYDLAERAHSNTEKLYALRLLGIAHTTMSKFDQAMAYFLQAHDMARQAGDPVTLGIILNSIGAAYLTQNRFDDALRSLQQALVLLEEVDLKPRITTCLTNIGESQFRRGQAHAALGAYRRAVAAGLAGGHQAGVAYIYLSQAEVSAYLGEYVQALASCAQALATFQQTGDAIGEAYVRLTQTGEVCIPLNLQASLLPGMESALHVMRESGNVDQSMYALLQLAESSLRDNKQESAEAYLRQIDDLDQAQLPLWRLSIKAWLDGRAALARGDLERANRMVGETERLVDTGSNPDVLGPSWVLRAQIALVQGDTGEACACFEQAIRAAQARSSFATRLSVLKMAGSFLADQPDGQAAALGQQALEEANTAQRQLDEERERVLQSIEPAHLEA